LSIHTDEKKLDAMMERAMKRRQDAPEIGSIQKLNKRETNNQFPLLSDDYQSVYVSGAARVNGRSLRESLINGAVKNGATFIKGSDTPLLAQHDITGVKVNNPTYPADKVLTTTGAWVHEHEALRNIPCQLTRQKAQI